MGYKNRATKKITEEEKALSRRIAHRLKAEREARGLTQVQLSEMIGNGCDGDDIYYLEGCALRKNLWLIHNICKMFGISMDALLSDDEYYVKMKVE